MKICCLLTGVFSLESLSTNEVKDAAPSPSWKSKVKMILFELHGWSWLWHTLYLQPCGFLGKEMGACWIDCAAKGEHVHPPGRYNLIGEQVWRDSTVSFILRLEMVRFHTCCVQ